RQAAAAVREVEGIEQSHLILAAHVGAGRLYVERGDVDGAGPPFETALAQVQRGNGQYFAEVGVHLAYAHVLARRRREAEELLESVLHESAPPWRLPTHFRAVSRYAPETALLLGRADQATELVDHALEFASTYGEPAVKAAALRLRGWLSTSRTPPEVDVAEHSYHEAL